MLHLAMVGRYTLPFAYPLFLQEQAMIEFNVTGMSCQHCVKAVTESIRQIDPAARVNIDLEQGRVAVESTQPVPELKAAIEDAGYTVAG
jgi:copper chaperone